MGYGNNHAVGLTCLEAKNELMLLKRIGFDWLVVVDDDVFVHVENLRRALNNISTGQSVWGIPGCGHCARPQLEHRYGLCGGGGYAIRRQGLLAMAAVNFTIASIGSETQLDFINEFMTVGDAKWCDVSFGCVAQNHGLELRSLPGLYGWAFESLEEEDRAINSRYVPPLIFHYVDGTRMRRLFKRFAEQVAT